MEQLVRLRLNLHLEALLKRLIIFKTGEVKNNLNIRIGTAKYEAEKFENSEMISLWRSSIFASLDSEYQIWKSNQKNLYQNKKTLLSPVLINPELVLRTNINSAYFNYMKILVIKVFLSLALVLKLD